MLETGFELAQFVELEVVEEREVSSLLALDIEILWRDIHSAPGVFGQVLEAQQELVDLGVLHDG